MKLFFHISFKSFIIVYFTFKSSIHLKLITMYGVKQGSIFIFFNKITYYPVSFINLFLPLICGSALLHIRFLYQCGLVSELLFYCCNCLSALSKPHCVNYYGFITIYITSLNPSTRFFFRILLVICGSLFCINFKINLRPTKNMLRFAWDCIGSIFKRIDIFTIMKLPMNMLSSLHLFRSFKSIFQ